MNEPVTKRVTKQIKAGNILDNNVTLFYYEKKKEEKEEEED